MQVFIQAGSSRPVITTARKLSSGGRLLPVAAAERQAGAAGDEMGARRGAAIPPSSESFVSGHRDHTEGLGSWLCGLSKDNNTVRFFFFFF